MADTKGKVKEVLGWATGDRDVEAQGVAEQVTEEGKPEDHEVEAVKEEVRADHGDIRTEDKRPG